MQDKENQSSYERILVVVALVLCCFIIGYNVFYQPSVEVIKFEVVSDSANELNSSNEEYTPSSNSSADRDLLQKVSSAQNEEPVNINTATKEQLSENLTGIGDVIAQVIIDYREQIGGFTSIDQLKDVKGIGDQKFDAIKNDITI